MIIDLDQRIILAIVVVEVEVDERGVGRRGGVSGVWQIEFCDLQTERVWRAWLVQRIVTVGDRIGNTHVGIANRSGHRAAGIKWVPHPIANPFIGSEKEQFVPDDRTTHGSSKLMEQKR